MRHAPAPLHVQVKINFTPVPQCVYRNREVIRRPGARITKVNGSQLSCPAQGHRIGVGRRELPAGLHIPAIAHGCLP